MRLYTIGHGAGSADELLSRARAAQVEAIVDVRTAPGSRRHPQFGKDAMAVWLGEAGIGYAWEQRLGGFRRPSSDSVNVALRNAAFRGYADYMRSDDFHEALAGVLTEAESRRVAVMCAETLWWRCHRRLISDAVVLLHRGEVLHVDGRGEVSPHRVTEGARVDGNLVVYDGGVESGLLV